MTGTCALMKFSCQTFIFMKME